MSQVEVRIESRRFLETRRRDRWWVQPLIVFLGLGAFVVYSTWAAFQGAHYFLSAGGAHYLSPMYSPVIFDPPGVHSGHAWFGPAPQWFMNLWPSALVAYSPAFLILIFPGFFRLTCYYYRGAYYKAFWAAPLNCTVGKPFKNYRGEAKLPLILQNIHRYFLYFAILFIGILSYDAIVSYIWTTADGSKEFGVGVGSIVLTINPILLGGYTFGCHSLRHLIGGRKDCPSRSAGGGLPYRCVSCLNRGHMRWAWVSLFWVAFTDIYVRLCSMGVWTDWRII